MEWVAFGATCCALTALLASRSSPQPSIAQAVSSTGAPAPLSGKYGLNIRRHFLLEFDSYRHLNHGSYGTCPRPVVAAAATVLATVEAFPDDFFRRKALNAYRETCNILAQSDVLVAPRDSVVLIENATAGVNTVLHSLELSPRDILVINDHTYNACKLAVKIIAARFGATVEVIAFPFPVADGAAIVQSTVNQLRDIALRHPDKRIRWVLVDHISSPTAIVMPVKSLCQVVHAIGAEVMIDGAHAPGQLALDMAEIGADWYTGNLHKWYVGTERPWAFSCMCGKLCDGSISLAF